MLRLYHNDIPRFVMGFLGQRPSLLPFNKKKIYILIKVVQTLHCFEINDLDPICSGTRVVQMIHSFVFNDLDAWRYSATGIISYGEIPKQKKTRRSGPRRALWYEPVYM